MREIKFRGKQVAYHRPWIYGSLLMLDGKAYILDDEDTSASINPSRDPESGTTYVEGLVEVDPSTIGQYTGLKASNGTEIYEGDIVKHRGYNGMQTSVVKFEAGAFIVGYHDGSSTKRRPMLLQDKVKVISNIHDNPELLEEGGER